MIDKRNEPFNYKFHGHFDISSIANHLETYSSEWFINQSRQNMGPVHKETTSVFLYDHPAMWSIKEPFKPTINYNQKEMHELIAPIINVLEQKHEGKVGKCLFIKLPAGKSILPHTDKLDYLGVVRRHHIAITTNDQVFFSVDNELKNMKIGECWEINNSKEHAVNNNGKTDRIHLLVDIMPNRFIKNDFISKA